MSSSSEGKGTLREWANSKKPLWLYSFGTIPYVREGAEVRIAPVGSTDRIVVEVLGAVPGLEPVKPSFNIAGAEFAQFAPDDIPADVPFSLDDIKGYKLFLWVRMMDKTYTHQYDYRGTYHSPESVLRTAGERTNYDSSRHENNYTAGLWCR